MDLQLKGRRVLVTGASKGIGLAAARVFASEGCDVVLVARRAEVLETACAEIRREFAVRAEPYAADLSRQRDIDALAPAVGEIDVLVNNAGAIPFGDLVSVDNDRFRAAWDLKVFGYISMCRAFYPVLKARRGVIVNVIGAGGEWLDPAYIVGSTGNAALMAFTKTLGKGAAEDGIRVVGINPGPVTTDRMISRLRDEAQRLLGDADRWAELNKDLPLGRAADPEEIGAAAAFLASPLSGSTAASILTIDGGLGRARNLQSKN